MTEAKEMGLLAEGMRSYPKALGALSEFQRIVISDIRDAVVGELSSSSTAIGVVLTEKEIIDRVRPSTLSNFDSKKISLGVKIDRLGKAGWSLYFTLWWWKDEPNLSVSIWLKDGKMAESIFARFVESSSKTRAVLESGHEISISRVLLHAEQLPVVLRELNREFAELWTKAGGLGKSPE
jgi:hypothetical protein